MKIRKTFHFRKEVFDALEVGESIVEKFTEDKKREYNAGRQQAYRWNANNKDKKLRVDIIVNRGYMTILREK